MVASANIRTANANDAARLKHCMVSAYAPYLERMGSARLPPMDVDYATEIENFPCWVVDRAGDILGGLIMVFTRDRASIANIAVDPSAQGQGVGGMLMRFAESTAKEKGFGEQLLGQGLCHRSGTAGPCRRLRAPPRACAHQSDSR